MSLLKVLIEVHFYSGEELCDGDIELRKQGRGLYSEPFNARLMSFHDTTIAIEVGDQLTLGDFQDCILNTIYLEASGMMVGTMPSL